MNGWPALMTGPRGPKRRTIANPAQFRRIWPGRPVAVAHPIASAVAHLARGETMTRFPNALMLTAALFVLSAPLTHAAQRQRRAERPDSESSPPARTAVPRGEAAQPAPDRGEAARPAPDSGRGASSAGRERGVDNEGRSRIPARYDEGRAERTREAARARAPRPSPPPPDTSNGSNSQPVN